MTLPELKIRKRELKEKIQNIIESFEKETETIVDSIFINRINTNRMWHEHLSSVLGIDFDIKF